MRRKSGKMSRRGRLTVLMREALRGSYKQTKSESRKKAKSKQTKPEESEVSLRWGKLSRGIHSGMPLKTTPTLQCKSKRYFALFTLINNRVLSVINSLIIAGDYRRLSHSSFCNASLLGYDLTILFHSYISELFLGPAFFLLPLQSKQTTNQSLHSLSRPFKRGPEDREASAVRSD